MQTLLERLQWVIDSKRVKNANRWCTDAGLSRTTVQMMMGRLAKGGESGVDTSTITALAGVAKVSPGWLAFGEGTPDESGSLPPRAQGRQAFLAELAYHGNGDRGRAFLKVFDDARAFSGMADRSPKDWQLEYEREFRAWANPTRIVGVTAMPDDDEDGPPIMRKLRKKHQ